MAVPMHWAPLLPCCLSPRCYHFAPFFSSPSPPLIQSPPSDGWHREGTHQILLLGKRRTCNVSCSARSCQLRRRSRKTIRKRSHCALGSPGGGIGGGLGFLEATVPTTVPPGWRAKGSLSTGSQYTSKESKRSENYDVSYSMVAEALAGKVDDLAESLVGLDRHNDLDDDTDSEDDSDDLYADEYNTRDTDDSTTVTSYVDGVTGFSDDEAGDGNENNEGEDGSSEGGLSLEVGVPHISDGRKTSQLEELCNRVQTSDQFTVTARDIAALYDFRFDKFQRMAIDGFLKGSSLVVCAPTSSGKTLIAEAAGAATLARGRRLFYTTPLKALSNQKLRDFRELFGETNVGLLTGDAAVNRDAPILIMTTEILRNMLYESVGSTDERGRLVDVDVVVLDEVHYLSDISRGTVWEETVIYCPKQVQLICLSATVANPEELAGWIAQVHGPTELVTSSRRPVPLVWHFSTRYSLLPLLNEQASEMNWRLSLRRSQQDKAPDAFWDTAREETTRKGRRAILRKNGGFRGHENRVGRRQNMWGEAEEHISEEEVQFLRRKQVPYVKDTLAQLKERDMLPAIWFIFSRKGCDTAVHYLQEVELLSEDEVCQVREAILNFREQYPEAVREVGMNSLLGGVAAHHAGCLPTWKSFIEELFQRGLIKVVFATETLAAGINMPARTTVLSSLSKRGDDGHKLLSSNAMLQMAGRAGRRGIDDQGHVVVVQTPFEGAEDCCKLLFAGSDPLVSQFTATYGMALNLLAGARVIRVDTSSGADGDTKVVRRGRTLEEARALIEQSFGNYVGSEVMVAAKQQLAKLQQDVERLEKESTGETVSNGLESRLSKDELREYTVLKERVKEAKRVMRELREQVEMLRVDMVQPLLDACADSQVPFLCLCYFDQRTGEERLVPALYVGSVPRPPFISIVTTHSENGVGDNLNFDGEDGEDYASDLSAQDASDPTMEVRHYVALGSNNCWYIFTGKSVKSIHRKGLHLGAALPPGEMPVGANLKEKLQVGSRSWQTLGQTGTSPLSSVWCAESSMDTWAWACQVPLLSELSGAHEVSLELVKTERMLTDQRKEVSKLRKKLKLTQGYREYKLLLGLQKMRSEKLSRLGLKSSRIAARINQMQPSGWKEFLQVVEVLHAADAIHMDTHKLLALGEVAAAVRGENELWLAMAFTSNSLLSLMPAHLAAICGTFVSEGMKARTKDGPSVIYDVSSIVSEWVEAMEDRRTWLLDLQAKHGVEIPVEMDTQFAGLVEAWASGVTWKELMTDSGMDEGDVARLLRRSIDLLAQMPHLPHMDPGLAKTARVAAQVMDRPPISELIG